MADYYTLLTDAGIAYETACKAAGTPIKLSQISVGDGGGTEYNPAATATALKREVWRGPLNALFQDENNPSWLLAEVTIPSDVGGWYVREAGIWTDTGILYAIVKYPESFKPVLATSGSGKEFYIRSIFETSNAELVTLLIDDTVVKATRAWVASYVADELAKLDRKQSVRAATTANIVLSGAQTIDGVAVIAGDRVLVKSQTLAKDNGIYVAANSAWVRAKDADASADVTSGLIVSVEEGATLANTIWQLITDGVIVLGTTALMFQNITQGFAPLNSPVLVNPTANTPPLFDNTKSIATTEYVMRASGNYRGFTSLTSATTLTATAVGTLVSVIGTFTLTLPTANALPSGSSIHFRNIGGGVVTVACVGADLINAGNFNQPNSIALQPGTTLVLSSNGVTAWWAEGSAQLQYSKLFGDTPVIFDSSRLLATTEFVERAKGNYRGFLNATSNTTLIASTAFGSMISCLGTFNITLPAANSGGAGGTISIRNRGAGVVTILCPGSDNIKSGRLTKTTMVMPVGSTLDLTTDGASGWWASGSAQIVDSAAINSLMGNYSGIKIITASTDLTVNDTGCLIIGSAGLTGLDVTLPQLSTTTPGQSIIISAGAGSFNLKAFAGDPGISIGLSVLPTVPIDVFESIILVSNPSGWRVVSGTVLNKYSGMFSASIGTSGSQEYPSGLIRQWGTFNAPSIASGAYVGLVITLPKAFPNGLLSSSASVHNQGLCSAQPRPNGSSKTTIVVCVNNNSTLALTNTTGTWEYWGY
ncbi:phage tail protein [Pseudomonas sp. FP2300]|uniref:phage tail protein n=1 Tax=Pseudomonas sp. FP2300 TaxID=2954090 RepID=UPI0027345998|nr:phage tail protein [Pseudomonas sp. FP2300]WLH64098.1 phage tail protein [Pseudomonas sp. FP2300]